MNRYIFLICKATLQGYSLRISFFHHFACVFCCCIISMHKSDFESIQKWTLCNNAKKAKQKGPSIFIALFQYQTILLFTWTRLYSRHKNRVGFIASSLPPSIHPFNSRQGKCLSLYSSSLLFFILFVNSVCVYFICIIKNATHEY